MATNVEQLERAEKIILDRLSKAADESSVDLVQAVADAIDDRSIASLAVWELLDRGQVEFGERSRERLRLVNGDGH